MSQTNRASKYARELKVLEGQLDKLEERSERPKDKRNEDEEEKFEEKLVVILMKACDLARRVETTDSTNVADVVEKVEQLTNRGINWAYGNNDLYINFLKSFAHTEETLLKDPMRSSLGQGLIDSFLSRFASFLGPSGVRRGKRFGPGPWKKFLQPEKATLASRFRRNVVFPSAATHPQARNVFEARCEVRIDDICQPIHLVMSSSGSCVVLTGAGWKNRDPVVSLWRPVPDEDGDLIEQERLKIGLAEIAYHCAIDDARKLVVTADDDRIKTFNWETLKGVHTMNSERYTGPLVVFSDGRVVRSGKGGAAVWNLDQLETHGAGRKKIGKGKYTLPEDSWRDGDAGDEVESSTGSHPHTTVKYTDEHFRPGRWHLHEPSSRILSSEKMQTGCEAVCVYSCFLLDLEQGKKAARFIGHGGDTYDFSTSPGDANAFATAATDGYARLWDIRHPLPQLTLDVEHSSAPCNTAVFAHLDGIPIMFTGGNRTEAIKFWDLRAKKTIYELSTGNNIVNSMKWDGDNSILYAATESMYMDRLGSLDDYRKFQRPKFKAGAKNNSEESLHRTASDDEDSEEEEEEEDVSEEGEGEEDEDDDELDDDDYGGMKWPKRAFHSENYFGCAFDSKGHQLYRYQFKEDPSLDIWPQTMFY